MKTGERVVMKHVEARLDGFTAYKSYEVVSGEGEVNVSPIALKLGTMIHHSERTFNLIDDKGRTRFCSTAHFRPFNAELGGLFQ
ncbi:hypothetical protein Fifi44_00004 [Erwinia phage Fifi44]|uniref:Uncharacterized protein n=1 Tax=Erwinia phage Fifi44 TaxID=2876597 RepID=A0AAE8Y4C8_9CAUD|nr:hypothetical protein QNG95_gp04 [Erwinia phage Fifi44]QQV88308.1 hypothetical protein pEaSNUABM27_00005 [Erwinia phage pEa_SNUABM_27]UCR74873.1 hypothetical protein Fifi44_00004 [Erwinia phage Fifi44]UCR80893.1 hypothetical protein Fifi451_00073 [Erwinia phage Fifi451]